MIATNVRLCRRCGERDTLNCFGRCDDCELAYQKDLLLSEFAAINAHTHDDATMRLLVGAMSQRAAELLKRGE